MTSTKSCISPLWSRGRDSKGNGDRIRSSIIANPLTALMIAAALFLVPHSVANDAHAQTTGFDSLVSALQGSEESLNQDSFRVIVQRYMAARKQGLLGRPAPALETTSISGVPWRLVDQRGKIVVLEFWASWCVACKPTTKAVAELREKYEKARDVVFVGVALDDSLQKAVEFCRENRIDWLQLFEPSKGMRNSCAKALGVWTIPEVCVIDERGTVVSIFLRSKNSIEKAIESLRERERGMNDSEHGTIQGERSRGGADADSNYVR